MKIKVSDLIKKGTVVPANALLAMENLTAKVNQFFAKYPGLFVVPSGFRTMEDHLRIYREKGIVDPAKIPMRSNHLTGHAVDLVPRSEAVTELKQYVLENILLAEELGLYFEDFGATKNWVHVQDVAPSSGKRFFKP